MSDLTISAMFELQNRLIAAHPEWHSHEPESLTRQLLWMVGEVGEVIDVLKKNSTAQLLQAGYVREHFVEECTDVLMYLFDSLICCGVTPEELSESYTKKHNYNMVRFSKPFEQEV